LFVKTYKGYKQTLALLVISKNKKAIRNLYTKQSTFCNYFAYYD